MRSCVRVWQSTEIVSSAAEEKMSKASNGYSAVSQNNGVSNHDVCGGSVGSGEGDLVKLKPRLGLVQGRDFLWLFSCT